MRLRRRPLRIGCLLRFLQAPGGPLPFNSAPGWVQALIGAWGGWGLLLIAFFDSSFGTLPILNDLLVIWFSIQNPDGMVFYAAMATLGSVLGCLTIFAIAHKGGEAVLRRKASPEQIERIRRWYERNEFLTVAIPAILPPPTPFKIFVLAAGAFQVRLKYFLAALAVGRGLRYFLWGFLAVAYREKAISAVFYMRDHPLHGAGIGVVLMGIGYLVLRTVHHFQTRPAAES